MAMASLAAAADEVDTAAAPPIPDRTASPAVVLTSCLLLSIVSGSFYLWSLILPSLQSTLGCARAPLSAVFSLATVCFTTGTSVGPTLLGNLSTSTTVLLIACIGSTGLLLSSFIGALGGATLGGVPLGLPLLAIGWGVCFGSMSGLAYALNARISTSPLFAGRNGLATGLLVSGRAAAPMVATPLVLWALSTGGIAMALRCLGLYFGVALLPAALALRSYDQVAPTKPTPTSATDSTSTSTSTVATAAPPPPAPAVATAPTASSAGAYPGRWTIHAMWLALLCGSGPGLLCHAHAAAMLTLCGTGDASLGALGVSAMAIGSLVGRMGGGVLIDIVPARTCLGVLPLLCAGAVLAPLLRPSSVLLTAAALVSCGLAYGLNAVALPVLVSRLFGAQRFSSGECRYMLIMRIWRFQPSPHRVTSPPPALPCCRLTPICPALQLAVYGRIFTAWGTAGVLAPWLAGKLFDVTGGYSAALVVSAVSLVVSALAASALPRDE